MVIEIYSGDPTLAKVGALRVDKPGEARCFFVPLNIAEGSTKRGSREFRRFLDIALGSMSELTYCLGLARELRYLSE
jgi:hypothetical protein